MTVPGVAGGVRVRFCGVGDARGLSQTLVLPVCPRVDEEVCFGSGDDADANSWAVRTVVHYVNAEDFDVYCVVGPPRRY